MRVHLSRRALRNLNETSDYTHVRNPAAALRVKEALQVAVELIAAHSRAGRPFAHRLRRFAVPRAPYLVYYRVDEVAAVVEVIATRHGARQGD